MYKYHHVSLSYASSSMWYMYVCQEVQVHSYNTRQPGARLTKAYDVTIH